VGGVGSDNSIVEKHPTQVKLQPGEPGAEEEFRLLLSSNVTNLERYVEWRRAEDDIAA